MKTIVPENCQDLIALAQYGLARVAAAQGNYRKSKELGEACLRVLENIGYRKVGEVDQWLNSIGV
jgi:hypothetical protein